MARGDPLARFQALEEPGGEIEAGDVAADRLVEGDAERATKGVEQRAVDERRAEALYQADRGPRVSISGIHAARQIEIPGSEKRSAQLLEVVLVAERGILVEPLRHQHLRRRAFRHLPIEKNTGPDKGLGRL